MFTICKVEDTSVLLKVKIVHQLLESGKSAPIILKAGTCIRSQKNATKANDKVSSQLQRMVCESFSDREVVDFMISDSYPRSHEFQTSIHNKALHSRTRATIPRIVRMDHARVSNRRQRISHVPYQRYNSSKGSNVLLMVEPCCEDPYRLRSSMSRELRGVRFQERKKEKEKRELTDGREVPRCLPRVKKRSMLEDEFDNFYFLQEEGTNREGG